MVESTIKLILIAVCFTSSFVQLSSFAIPLELAGATSKIHSMMQQNDTRLVEIQGYVIAKRDFGKKLCFFDIADQETKQKPVQAMWKAQDQDHSDEVIHQRLLILPGAQICITGMATPSKNTGQSVLSVRSIELIRIPNNPQHVRILLQGLLKEQLNMNEFCKAANISSGNIFQSKLDRASSLQALAKEIVNNQTSTTNADILFDRQKRGFTLPEPENELLNLPTTIQGGNNANVTIDQLLQQGSTQHQHSVVLRVWIQNRRKFLGGISTVELTDSADNDDRRIRGILHPNLISSLDELYYIVAPGSHVEVSGTFVAETCKLWISAIKILRCSPRPSVVRHMIESLHQSKLSADAAAVALGISTATAASIGSASITERQWKAEEIANSLQAMDDQGHGDDNFLQSYEHLRKEYPLFQESIAHSSSTADNRSIPGSRWKRKKEPQLDWISNRIGDLLQDHPDYGKRKIRILDIGGGQGYLANRLSSLHSTDLIEVRVVDIAERTVKNGAMRSKRLNHHAVQYSVGDASHENINFDADIVVGLHACGTLTDVALAHAVRNNATFVICPCCYKSNPHLQIPGVIGDSYSRQALSQEAFWGIDQFSCNQLRSLAELQLQPNTASKAAHSICSIRAAAVKRFIPEYCVEIRAFPVAFSTRNHCMIGSLRPKS